MQLRRERHISYCRRGLGSLNVGFEVLDASRPWICYWNSHSLDLLGYSLADDKDTTLVQRMVDFLGTRCQNKDSTGGFGGGPGQLSHLAPTYASINCLAILGTQEAFECIDRCKLYGFIMSMKCVSGVDRNSHRYGGFTMHDDGEVDIRATYCALSVAALTGIIDDAMLEGVLEYIARCQTHEGGFGSYSGNEAHGGYTFCALASLCIMIAYHRSSREYIEHLCRVIDIPMLVHWSTMRQMSYEGGFQGRTNKLVDACYSHWVGGTFPLLCWLLMQTDRFSSALIPSLDQEAGKLQGQRWQYMMDMIQWPHNIDHDKSDEPTPESLRTSTADRVEEIDTMIEIRSQPNPSFPELLGGDWLMDHTALQEYLLLCCQQDDGGLRDKPSKSRDFYHTCYALSGLSYAQHHLNAEENNVLGDLAMNELRPANPIFNVCLDKVDRMTKYFARKDKQRRPDKSDNTD